MKRHLIETGLVLLICLAFLGYRSTVCCAGGEREAVVAIDVGHSPERGGATSARGIPEYIYNKKIAEAILKELKQAGISGAFIINGRRKEITLRERTQIARSARADLLISIHHDSVQETYLRLWNSNGKSYHYCDEKSGFSIFIGQQEPVVDRASGTFARLVADRLLAASMHPTLHHAEDTPGERRLLLDPARGIYRNDHLAVLHGAGMPAILLECGVIVNREEEERASSPEQHQKVAVAIRDAVRAYYAIIKNKERN